MRVKIHHEGTPVLVAMAAILVVINLPLWLWVRPLAWATGTTLLSAALYLVAVNFFRSS